MPNAARKYSPVKAAFAEPLHKVFSLYSIFHRQITVAHSNIVAFFKPSYQRQQDLAKILSVYRVNDF